MVILVLSYGLSPLNKLPTEMAMTKIEKEYINFSSMTDEQLKNYEFLSNWIRWNDKGFKQAARERRKFVALIAVGSSLICLYVALFLRNTDKTRSKKSPKYMSTNGRKRTYFKKRF